MKPLIIGGDVKSIASNGFVSTTMMALSKTLLDPSTGTATSSAEKFRAIHRIRRPEFWPAGITAGLFPVAATAKSGGGFFGIDLALAWTVICLGTHVGMMVNCLADRDADMAFKSAQAMAVRALGVRNILGQIVVTSFVELVLFIVLVVRTQSPLVVAFGAVAAFLSVQYSLPPLHLKSRGVLEILTVGIATLVIPGLVVMVAARHCIAPIGALALTGGALIMCSLILVETAEDVPEDRKFGVNTTAVCFGLVRTIYFAMTLDLLGVSVLGYSIISQHALFPGTFVALASGLLPLTYLIRIVWSMRGHDENRQIEALRAHSRYLPIILASTGAGMVIGMFLSFGTLGIRL